jgi:hypothetical protein
MKTPNAYRPLYSEYLTVAAVIKLERNIYDMTEQEFQTLCMIHSNGSMNPKRAVEILRLLKEEAGL